MPCQRYALQLGAHGLITYPQPLTKWLSKQQAILPLSQDHITFTTDFSHILWSLPLAIKVHSVIRSCSTRHFVTGSWPILRNLKQSHYPQLTKLQNPSGHVKRPSNNIPVNVLVALTKRREVTTRPSHKYTSLTYRKALLHLRFAMASEQGSHDCLYKAPIHALLKHVGKVVQLLKSVWTSAP